MKNILLFASVFTLTFGSCKTKQATVTTTAASIPMQVAAKASDQTRGKVSHQYRSTGCSTVIIVKSGQEVITLIPKDKLPEQFDKDGLEIRFDYLPLKMHNPAGCNTGFPATISNIKAAK